MARRNNVGSEGTMSIMGHLREFRTRLTVSAFVLVAGAILAYIFRDHVIKLLMEPLGGRSLMYLNPAGGFSFILLVSIYAGLALATPVIVYNLYAFLRPALPMRIQRYSLAMLVCSTLLMIAGIAFGYVFAIPGALNFLYEFAGEYVTAELTADSYLNFIVAYTIGLGLVFQLPLLLMIFHWIKPQTPSGLMKSERWVIVLGFAAAAIITPTPDPLNQTIIALPIIIVYQLGVGAVLISVYRQHRNEKRRKRRSVMSTKLPEPEPNHQPIKPIVDRGHSSNLKPKPATASIGVTNRPIRRSVDGFGLVVNQPSSVVQRSFTKPSTRSDTKLSTQPRGNLSVDGILRST